MSARRLRQSELEEQTPTEGDERVAALCGVDDLQIRAEVEPSRQAELVECLAPPLFEVPTESAQTAKHADAESIRLPAEGGAIEEAKGNRFTQRAGQRLKLGVVVAKERTPLCPEVLIEAQGNPLGAGVVSLGIRKDPVDAIDPTAEVGNLEVEREIREREDIGLCEVGRKRFRRVIGRQLVDASADAQPRQWLHTDQPTRRGANPVLGPDGRHGEHHEPHAVIHRIPVSTEDQRRLGLPSLDEHPLVEELVLVVGLAKEAHGVAVVDWGDVAVLLAELAGGEAADLVEMHVEGDHLALAPVVPELPEVQIDVADEVQLPGGVVIVIECVVWAPLNHHRVVDLPAEARRIVDLVLEVEIWGDGSLGKDRRALRSALGSSGLFDPGLCLLGGGDLSKEKARERETSYARSDRRRRVPGFGQLFVSLRKGCAN